MPPTLVPPTLVPPFLVMAWLDQVIGINTMERAMARSSPAMTVLQHNDSRFSDSGYYAAFTSEMN